MIIDITIIALFLVTNLFIGYYSSKRIENINHFSVGHRAFNSFVIFATLSASFIGGGYTLGNAAKVYSAGVMYSFALLGFSLKEVLVATLIAPRMDQYRDCISIGDIIARRYGVVAKVVTGIFAMLLCAGILGAQVGAMGAIFNRFLHVSPIWGILIGFSIIIIYSTLGGMKAVVYTDILQFIVLIIGLPLTFIVGYFYVGGWHQIHSVVPSTHLVFLSSGQQWVAFLSLFITFIFGETLVPPYVQRLFMGKSATHTRNGTLASGIVSIPFFLMIGAIGLIAYVIKPHLDPNTALPFVVETVLPVGVRGFVVAGLLAVIMSSAAGFLNAAAVSCVNDIVKPVSGDKLSETSLLRFAKFSTLVVGIGSVFFALAINNVLDILLYAYNFWAPIILIPLLAVIFNKQAKPINFFIGSIAGIFGMLIWTKWLNTPLPISGVVVGLLCNLIGFSLSRYFTNVTLSANPTNN